VGLLNARRTSQSALRFYSGNWGASARASLFRGDRWEMGDTFPEVKAWRLLGRAGWASISWKSFALMVSW